MTHSGAAEQPWEALDVRAVGVAEAVANIIRRRIFQGAYSETGVIPKLDQLRAEFQVSPVTLREALRILETEKLITVRRGNVGGAVVQMPDAASAAYALGLAMEASSVTVKDLAAALLTTEPACARLCAEREDRAGAVVPILQALNDQAVVVISESLEFTRAARRFHEAVPELCGNGTLRIVTHALDALWSAQEEQWVHGMSESGHEPDVSSRHEVVAVHDRLIKAISDGKPDRADQLSRIHLEATQAYMFAHNANRVIDSRSTAVQTHLRSFGKRV